MRNSGAFEATLNGVPVLVTPEKDGLMIGRRVVDYADIQTFGAERYRAVIHTAAGPIELQRMGGDLTPFLYRLGEIYGARVTQALFQSAEPLLTAKGQYNGAPVKVALYPDCVFLLPAGSGCARLPLCYCEEPVRQGYDVRLSDGAQTCVLSRLGYDTDNLVRKMGEAIYQLDAATAARLDAFSGAGGTEGRRLAPYLSQGRGCTAEALMGTALLEALEKAVEDYVEPPAQDAPPTETEAEEERHAAWELYTTLKGRFGAGRVLLGLLPDETESIVWFAAFHRGRAVMELLAQEATATFLYRYEEPDDAFPEHFNRALEAAGFRREIIALPEDKLQRDTDGRLAVSMSRDLRWLRGRFTGRAIHTSPDSWLKKVLAHFD